MELNYIWFGLIVVLFTVFFLLEGFDYGVGTILPFMTSKDNNRRMILRSILPVWDGNEVWMLTAGGALFAAFPHVYATMFSTFYIALFLMLVALILRGVAFDLRSRHDSPSWRVRWDAVICISSAVPAILWGVAVTNLIQGLPINEHMIYQGTFFDLLSPYTLIGGLAFFFVFAFHGAAFLGIRLSDDHLIRRAHTMGLKFGSGAIVFFVLCMILTYTNTDLFNNTIAAILLVLAALVFLIGYRSLHQWNFRIAFICSSLAVAFTTISFFLGLFPRLMVSSLNPKYSLDIFNSASTPYTLTIMTYAAVCLVPVVILYQIWSYWLFRTRVTAQDVEQEH